MILILLSGNTGIGLALAAAVKGYKCIIVMPEKMSAEKANVLRALGAEIVRTPTSASFDHPNSHISIAQRLCRQIKNSVILDQYINPGNPLAHYDTTAEEILSQCENKVDMIVLGAGTGGTITGIGRKFKKVVPNCTVVGVDPVGSILYIPENANNDPQFYEVEGIGYDFVPTVLDSTVVDKWYKCEDKESLLMARELISKEGILCGGSSGSAMAAALKAAKNLQENQRCVVILADGVRNYMTKFLDDDWMEERGFVDSKNEAKKSIEKQTPWFANIKVNNIAKGVGLVSVNPDLKCSEAINLMKEGGYDQVPVVDSGGFLLGIVTVSDTMAKVAGGFATLDDSIKNIMLKDYPKIERQGTIGQLISLLRTNHYVAVVEKVSESGGELIAGILTHIDVLNYLIVADNYDH